MKIKILTLISILTVVSLIFNSCRKGEDDPWISLRSRDNRVIGKWKLEEYSKEYKIYNKTKTTNNINNNYDIQIYDSKEEESYNDNKLITNSYFKNISEEFKTTYSTSNSIFFNKKTYYYQYNHYNKEYSYKIDLELKKNHTWTAEISKTAILYKYDDNKLLITDGDTIVNTYSDTNYVYTDSYTWTDEGNWYWEDSDKDKIYINAGPMKGYLKRLSNKEIIIENFKYNNKNDVDNSYIKIKTYDDINDPYKEIYGTESKITNTDTTLTETYKWVAN